MHWLNDWEALGPVIKDLRRAASQKILLLLEGDHRLLLVIFFKRFSEFNGHFFSAFVHVSKKH